MPLWNKGVCISNNYSILISCIWKLFHYVLHLAPSQGFRESVSTVSLCCYIVIGSLLISFRKCNPFHHYQAVIIKAAGYYKGRLSWSADTFSWRPSHYLVQAYLKGDWKTNLIFTTTKANILNISIMVATFSFNKMMPLIGFLLLTITVLNGKFSCLHHHYLECWSTASSYLIIYQ